MIHREWYSIPKTQANAMPAKCVNKNSKIQFNFIRHDLTYVQEKEKREEFISDGEEKMEIALLSVHCNSYRIIIKMKWFHTNADFIWYVCDMCRIH